jgi:hypothetical protein
MAIPIPSGLPITQTVNNRQNDLITPPSAPSVVESLAAIDPRVALNMPLPVADSSAGGSLRDAVQNLSNRQVASPILPEEPSVDQAVLLEISSLTENQAQITSNSNQSTSLLSQNLSRMDATGSAALGQLLSDILAVNVPELGQAVQTGKVAQDQNVVVNWPASSGLATNAGSVVITDPRQAMSSLYQNLQNSGIFAADQLKKLFFPASEDADTKINQSEDMQTEASHLLTQLSSNSSVQDSVKLLLRGDLLWQGQIMPNVQGKLYREDAWEADPRDPTQMIKGSKITMEVTLPNLGFLKVIGTQLGENVNVAIEAAPDSQAVLENSFALLLEQIYTQIDPRTQVSMKEGAGGNG